MESKMEKVKSLYQCYLMQYILEIYYKQGCQAIKQGVEGLQAFAFCVVTVNDEHTKYRFKTKVRG